MFQGFPCRNLHQREDSAYQSHIISRITILGFSTNYHFSCSLMRLERWPLYEARAKKQKPWVLRAGKNFGVFLDCAY